jgi:hypothetical protein
MFFSKCSSIFSSRIEDDLLILRKGECKLDIIDSVGTLVIKIKKLKTNLIEDDSETDETIIMHKVSV